MLQSTVQALEHICRNCIKRAKWKFCRKIVISELFPDFPVTVQKWKLSLYSSNSGWKCYCIRKRGVQTILQSTVQALEHISRDCIKRVKWKFCRKIVISERFPDFPVTVQKWKLCLYSSYLGWKCYCIRKRGVQTMLQSTVKALEHISRDCIKRVKWKYCHFRAFLTHYNIIFDN